MYDYRYDFLADYNIKNRYVHVKTLTCKLSFHGDQHTGQLTFKSIHAETASCFQVKHIKLRYEKIRLNIKVMGELWIKCMIQTR